MADKLIKVKQVSNPSRCCIMAVCISVMLDAHKEVKTVIM